MCDTVAYVTRVHFFSATTVADLNISTTRLATQLVPLHQRAGSLAERLTQLQEQNMAGKENRERTAAREMANTQTTMLKLKRELDVRVK